MSPVKLPAVTVTMSLCVVGVEFYFRSDSRVAEVRFEDAVEVARDWRRMAASLRKVGHAVRSALVYEPAVALLSERVRNGVASNLYKEKLEHALKEAAKHGQKGSAAPDFTLNDINGKPLALSSLRGKWVVLDFWGSWCVWCIKGMPKMKEYYAKYQDKLEILGVDCNDTVEKWKEAVAKHEIPWLHVYWDKEKGDNPLELYHVDGFPTKIILDPEGCIAKVVVGESPAFYDYLDEVLK